uniref:H/ACA ribonucleoprotein complex subunit 2 n=2 Tax=Plectus sambesii TaxID=2011161 RepID=A0A914VZJ3_9BILA
MGKLKVEPTEEMETDGKAGPLPEPTTEKGEYEDLCAFVNPIAQPLAGRKIAKKLYKLVKKAAKEKNQLRQGIHDVHKALRRGETGLIILAGNVTPIDVYCHVPALCEEKDMPYVFTPSREHLGLAAGHRRPAVLVLIRPHDSYQELLDECVDAVKKLPVERE